MTIFGQGAGASSVLLHVLSPKSEGLFAAAIAQSGTPIAPWHIMDRHPAYYVRQVLDTLSV